MEISTNAVNKIFNSARTIALDAGHASLEPSHLALATFNNRDSIGTLVCSKMGVDVNKVVSLLENEVKKRPSQEPKPLEVSASTALRRVMDAAKDAQKKQQDSLVANDHLILALYTDKAVASIFKGVGLSQNLVEKTLLDMRSGRKVESANAEESYDALNKYGVDLCASAEEGKLDPVIGRDDEIRRVVQILARRTKNNPVLIGEPGVGKTAIAEGLARRIVEGDVPDSLRGCRLRTLDMGALVAGAKYRGEFEERLQAVLAEVKNSQGKIVLFIDEIHLVLGAGKTDGAMDAANLLKPLLARGELRCIGATTLEEYRKHVEADAAFERRFQQVKVDEPSVEATISILRGLRERYEGHHGVRIADTALVAAASLSARYITERFLPDKAIDLMDEAAARLRVEMDSRPEEIDELERKATRLEIEAVALEKEKDSKSKKRCKEAKDEAKNTREKLAPLLSRWEKEKFRSNELKQMKIKLDGLRSKAEVFQRNGDIERAADIIHYAIPETESQLERLNAEYASRATNNETVTPAHVTEIVSRWTGVPVAKLTRGERDKILQLETSLQARVVGQEDAVSAVCSSVLRSRAGLSNPNRPTGAFLFLGPTGVGKTELSKALADELFDGEKNMIRIDMSEYSESHSLARLIGAPPGYIGHDEGGQLSETVRRKPHSVVLFDEVEKAHPQVLNTLLQVLDDGRLTDGKGRTVNFSNTIIVLTSNVGAKVLLAAAASPQATSTLEHAKREAEKAARSHFAPELLNRMSAIVVFNPLGPTQLSSICHKAMNSIDKRLAQQDIRTNLHDSAIQLILDTSYDPQFGARPLERYLEKTVVTDISRLIISGELLPGETVNIETGPDGDLMYRVDKLEVRKRPYIAMDSAVSEESYSRSVEGVEGLSMSDH
jgi:ATP-dependent Clp protease ATP-binding subunit ClpB